MRVYSARLSGLAGPDSVAWKIHKERITIFGWAPAILLQFAHPLVAAGIAAHSTFYRQPGARQRRFQETLGSMLALTFGDGADVLQTGRRINAIHDRVNGRLPTAAGIFPAGAEYSAHDPALLRWVHATLLDAQMRVYALYVGPLSAAEQDRYCREASRVAPLLGIPDGYLPASRRELQGYLAAMLTGGEIAVSDTARELAQALLYPPGPRALAPLFWLMRLPAVGLLPAPVREGYGFRWDARRARTLLLSARLIRGLLRVLPPACRHWPAARAAYRRAAAGRSPRQIPFDRSVRWFARFENADQTCPALPFAPPVGSVSSAETAFPPGPG